MSIEKSYRLIPRELSIEYSAYESGLDRFVHPNKGEFLGRDALVKAHADGDKWKFVTMEVHGVTDADARGSEPLWKGDELVGRATNGGLRLAGRKIAGARHGAGRSTARSGPSWRSRFSASASARRSSRRAPTIRRMRGSGRDPGRRLERAK